MNYKLSFVFKLHMWIRGKYVQKSDDSKSIRSNTPLPFKLLPLLFFSWALWLWDPTSPTRDRTQGPRWWKHGVLTTHHQRIPITFNPIIPTLLIPLLLQTFYYRYLERTEYLAGRKKNHPFSLSAEKLLFLFRAISYLYLN